MSQKLKNLNRVYLEGSNHRAPKDQQTITIYFDEDKKCSQVIRPTESFESKYSNDLVHTIAGKKYHSFSIK